MKHISILISSKYRTTTLHTVVFDEEDPLEKIIGVVHVFANVEYQNEPLMLRWCCDLNTDQEGPDHHRGQIEVYEKGT